MFNEQGLNAAPKNRNSERRSCHRACRRRAPSGNPLPNAEFMRLLREAYGASFRLPASEWMLAIGASSCARKRRWKTAQRPLAGHQPRLS
jgi:hypothetical protein